MTEYEELQLQRQAGIRPFFQKVYDRVAQQSDLTRVEKDGVHNLSLAFADVQDPHFVDWCHLSESGNGIMAKRIAAEVVRIIGGDGGDDAVK